MENDNKTPLSMLSSEIIDAQLKQLEKCKFSGTIARIDTIKSNDNCVDKIEMYIYGDTGLIKAKTQVKNQDCLFEGISYVYEDYNSLPKEGENIDILLSFTRKEKKIISVDKVGENEYTLISGTSIKEENICPIDYSSLKQLPAGPGPNWIFVGIGMFLLAISLWFAISRLLKAMKF